MRRDGERRERPGVDGLDLREDRPQVGEPPLVALAEVGQGTEPEAPGERQGRPVGGDHQILLAAAAAARRRSRRREPRISIQSGFGPSPRTVTSSPCSAQQPDVLEDDLVAAAQLGPGEDVGDPHGSGRSPPGRRPAEPRGRPRRSTCTVSSAAGQPFQRSPPAGARRPPPEARRAARPPPGSPRGWATPRPRAERRTARRQAQALRREAAAARRGRRGSRRSAPASRPTNQAP